MFLRECRFWISILHLTDNMKAATFTYDMASLPVASGNQTDAFSFR